MAEFDETQKGERERWRSDPMTDAFLRHLAKQVKNAEDEIAAQFTGTGAEPNLYALKYTGGMVAGLKLAIQIARRQ